MFVERDNNGKVIGLYLEMFPLIAEEELPDDNDEIQAFLNPPPGPFVLQKMLLWARLTDKEADTVDAAMAAQPARLRGIWNSATEIRSDSEFFGTLEAFLTASLGADRAAELLQQE
jgi:hypothetical protein